MSYPTFVGELNPYGDDPRLALWPLPKNSAGGRLQRILGVRRNLYLHFPRFNLCTGSWDEGLARVRARFIEAENPCGSTVLVLLGRRVWNAFGTSEWGAVVGRNEPFTALSDSSGFPRYVLLPHPSGRSREWNDSGAAERVRILLHAVAPEVPWGEVAE